MLFERGRINKIKRAIAKAITPPSLLGIDRKIAYTHKKYHSGLMWIGVTRGFARRKFSGSVKRLGRNKIITKNKVKAITYPKESLIE
jgi:hypothetical protein